MEKATLIGASNIQNVYINLRKMDRNCDGIITNDELNAVTREKRNIAVKFKEGKISAFDTLQKTYLKLAQLDKQDGRFDGNIQSLNEHLGISLSRTQQNQIKIKIDIKPPNKTISFDDAMKKIEDYENNLPSTSLSYSRSGEKELRKIAENQYRRVVAKLVQTYPTMWLPIFYSLFYPAEPKSIDFYRHSVYHGQRERSVSYLKHKGIFEKIEKTRARFLMSEILGKDFGDNDNLKIMKLLDLTRYENFGWLWYTELSQMNETHYFERRAFDILNLPELKDSIKFLSRLSIEDFAKVLIFTGEPDHYFISWVITDAGYEAASTLSNEIKGGLINKLSNIVFPKIEKAIQDGEKENKNIVSALDILTACYPQNIPTSLLPFLSKHLDDERVSLTFSNIGERALPFLKKALVSRDYLVRTDACKTLSEFSNREIIPEDFIPLLINNLTHKGDANDSFKLRDSASSALRNIGERTMPYIKKALTSRNLQIRGAICMVLSHISISSPNIISNDIIPLLINNLSNYTYNEFYANDEASWTLKRIGKRALPFLRKTLSSSNTKIAKQVKEIIKEIEKNNTNE